MMIWISQCQNMMRPHKQQIMASGQVWKFVGQAGGCSFSAFSDAGRGKILICVMSGINRVRLLEDSQSSAHQFHNALYPS